MVPFMLLRMRPVKMIPSGQLALERRVECLTRFPVIFAFIVLAVVYCGDVANAGTAVADPELESGSAYIEAAMAGDIATLADKQSQDAVISGEMVSGLYDVDEFLLGIDVSENDYARIDSIHREAFGSAQLEPLELYGEAIDPAQLEQVAPLIVQQTLEVSDYVISDLVLAPYMPVLDAFDVPIGVLWNFSWSGGFGYVALSTHTRAPLVLAFSAGSNVSLAGDLHFAGNGQIYTEDVTGGASNRSVLLANSEFQLLLADSRDAALAMDREYLVGLEQQTKAQINNATGIVQTDWLDTPAGSDTSYNGQDADSAYANYGGIYDIPAYIKDRYGATSVALVASKNLAVSKFSMEDYGVAHGGDCVPTSITRTFWYYRVEKYFTALPSSRLTLYNRIVSIAKDWGFSQSSGTNPVNIDNIMALVATNHNLKSVTKGIYVYSWSNTVKSEIDDARPLLLSLDQGTCANHTVTVNGYRVYSYRKSNGDTGTVKFLDVMDGWKVAQRYIDFNLMSGGTLRGTLASFNTMELEK